MQASLGVQLDSAGSARKRRSIGARTKAGTWARVECRGLDRPLDLPNRVQAARSCGDKVGFGADGQAPELVERVNV